MTPREKELTASWSNASKRWRSPAARTRCCGRKWICWSSGSLVPAANNSIRPNWSCSGTAGNVAIVAVAVAAPEKERSKSSGKERVPRLPENLPVVEEVIDPEPVKAQPEAVALHRPGSQRATGL